MERIERANLRSRSMDESNTGESIEKRGQIFLNEQSTESHLQISAKPSPRPLPDNFKPSNKLYEGSKTSIFAAKKTNFSQPRTTTSGVKVLPKNNVKKPL